MLGSGLPENFFVTQFVDSRAGNEFYRKIRAAFVQDEIVIVRVDYDAYWNVRGRNPEKRVQFYLENAHLLDEESAFARIRKRGWADPPSSRSGPSGTGFPWMCSAWISTLMPMGG